MFFEYLVSILLFLAGSSGTKSPVSPGLSTGASDSTFTNPLALRGPDPWVFQKDSVYYYTHTFGNRIAIYATTSMSQLGNAKPVTIWTPPATGPYSKQLWAPEIHFIRGKWYVYFAADDGNNSNHRVYVIENDSPDPTTGTWNFKGKIADTTADKWAIDASIFQYSGKLYLVWSGWEGDVNIAQNIYIAKMKDPLTMDGGRVLISSPQNAWEKIGTPTVNEGPEALINSKGQLFLAFSASGCWTDNYALGLLKLKSNGDPMNPSHWTKLPAPVFSTDSTSKAFGPGHNSFFKSKDGKQDWILYHANPGAGQGCGNSRSPRIQQFTWRKDGTPDFGIPVPINTPIQKPSGE